MEKESIDFTEEDFSFHREKVELKMNDTIAAYLKAYSHQPDSTYYAARFIQEGYQQSHSDQGYGYINLAEYLQSQGKMTVLWDSFKLYVDYLRKLEADGKLESYPSFQYMSKEELQQFDPFSVKVDASKGQPNQKWHLIFSYLGSTIFLDGNPRIHLVICPELWLYLLECMKNEAGFTDSDLESIYENAIAFRKGTIDINEWKEFIKPYRIQLNEYVMNEYYK